MVKKLIALLLIVLLHCGWTYTYTFEDGVEGNQADTGNGFSTPGDTTCGVDVLFNDDYVKNGSMAARVNHIEASTGWSALTFINPEDVAIDGAEIWTGGWFYFGEAADNIGSGDWSWSRDDTGQAAWGKWFRVHKADVADDNAGYSSIYFQATSYPRLDNESGSTVNIWQTADPKVGVVAGQWYYVEQYWKFSGSSGWCTLWINNEKVIDEEQHWTSGDPTKIDFFYVWSYWNGGHPQNQYSWMDDIYVSSEQRSSVYEEEPSASGVSGRIY